MTEQQPAGAEEEILGPAATPTNGAHDAPGAPENGAEPPPEPLPEAGSPAEPEGELDPLAERDRYLALAQRTQADFENYRKRTARELESAQMRGVVRLAKELVPALDNLERAMTVAQQAPTVDEQLIEGLRLVQRELIAALERAGIERYGVAGEEFDPSLHEALAHQPVPGAEPGAVVEVYQPGYRLAGSVIRAARVLVAA
jgi:molecular chaperone GrpE